MADDKGRIALVRIAATDASPETLLVEVTLGDESVTIVEDTPNYRVSPALRELAHQMIKLVQSEVEKDGGN